MDSVRLNSRLDIKAPNLIKGIHLERLRVIGDPREHATRYYQEGADELLYMDVSLASINEPLYLNSFAAIPSNDKLRLADTSYVRQKICAAASSYSRG